MKNGQEPDLTAEVPRIGGDDLERCGDGVEQDGIDDCLIVKGDLGDFGRHREHDVEVRHRQQIGLTVGEPPFARRALTLGTMPVAAGVIADAGMCAVLTGLDMTAKRRSPAELDRGHDAALDAAEMAVMGNTIGMIMATEISATSSSERIAGLRRAAPPPASGGRAGSASWRSCLLPHGCSAPSSRGCCAPAALG